MIVETSGEAWLCHLCDGELTRFTRLEEEVKSVSSKIVAKIHSFNLLSTSVGANSEASASSSSTADSSSVASRNISGRKRGPPQDGDEVERSGQEQSPGVKV